MAWNEPGGDKNRDPWGNKNNEQGPPDLDEALGKLKDKLFGWAGGGNGGKGGSSSGGNGGSGILPIVLVALIALIAAAAYNMTYQIDPAYKGVVLRFGKYHETIDPGLHFQLPFIEKVYKVNVRQINTKNYSESMLTQDENIVKVKLGVLYRVGNNPKDAHAYLFNTQRADRVLEQAARSAIREVVGKGKMDFVLKEGRADVAEDTKILLQSLLNDYGTGLLVQTVNLEDAQPPEPVQDAFDDAIKAREDKQRKINEAEEYANGVIPEARGEAARMEQESQAYKQALVAKADGEAFRFEALLAEYQKAPEVTRERLYLETTEQALSSVSKVIVDGDGSNNLMYLPLDKLMQAGAVEVPVAKPAPGGSRPPPRSRETSTSSSSSERRSRRTRGER